MKYLLLFLAIFIFSGCLSGVQTLVPKTYNATIIVTGDQFKGRGAGVYIKTPKGNLVVISAYHVASAIIDMNSSIILRKPESNNQSCPATILRADPDHDLVILKPDSNCTNILNDYTEIAASNPKIGETVWTIGVPYDEAKKVSLGIVSHYFKERGVDYFGFNGQVTFGNSGGGLFNRSRQLCGIVSSVLAVGGQIALHSSGQIIALSHIKQILKDI